MIFESGSIFDCLAYPGAESGVALGEDLAFFRYDPDLGTVDVGTYDRPGRVERGQIGRNAVVRFHISETGLIRGDQIVALAEGNEWTYRIATADRSVEWKFDAIVSAYRSRRHGTDPDDRADRLAPAIVRSGGNKESNRVQVIEWDLIVFDEPKRVAPR